ncbi:MAG: exonuclease SbcCD subunit D C-terminal domain-containing protein [Deltaproteobacteria bacterium]|jgi:exonuclease SbcD|nr:exonuclease SbcCD subunit D C-terminal domain-containing protein [Deltaproteobacteria bacterium]
MKILHTSDWHLSRRLYKIRRRYHEFSSFLNWLIELINEREIEVLIVAGDIFDSSAPTNRAQTLYYDFLRKIAISPSCRHVIVTSGNHDSPSFLEAPASLLKSMGIYVVGLADAELNKEILILKDLQGHPEMIVCAIPYLREGDLRSAQLGESSASREEKINTAISEKYQMAFQKAKEINLSLNRNLPMVAIGHLFMRGGMTLEGDGVRESRVGSLSALPIEAMPAFDYLALGHLHIPQRVGGNELIRYSGSPIPMGFNECGQQKSLCLVEFNQESPPRIELIKVPVFQELRRLEGDLNNLVKELTQMKALGSEAWVDVTHLGQPLEIDLRASLEAAVEGSKIEILAIRQASLRNAALSLAEESHCLERLGPKEVFIKLLEDQETPKEYWLELTDCYEQILTDLLEQDSLEQ